MRIVPIASSIVLAMALGAGLAQAQTAKTPPVSATAGPVEADAQAMQSTDQAAMGKMTMRQQIQDQLSRNGYTNVTVMPSSFFVRATNKQGNPVEMVIGPDSFTTVTEIAPKSASAAPAQPTAPAPAKPGTAPGTKG